jgi:hypothetical protein
MSLYDKASLIQIPSGYKGGKLYSVVPNDGVGDFTFSRGSAATRINEQGLIETMGSTEPRLNWDDSCPSLLLEPQRTNLSTYSEDFSNSAWTKGSLTVSSNTTVAPDGTLTADSVTPNATTNAIRLYQAHTTSATDYSLSFFVKSNGRQYIQLLFGGVLSAVYSNFDLVNGTVTAGTSGAGKIEDYNNGWYRISLKASLNAGSDQIYLWSIDSGSAARGSTSTGNGTDGYYVWGSQFEQGKYPTSYIKTINLSVTRLVDRCNNAGSSSLFNDNEGVLFAEILGLEGDDSVAQLGISNGSDNENVKIIFLNLTTMLLEAKMTSHTNFAVAITINRDNINKVAIQYKANDYKVFVNGTKQSVTQVSATPTGLDRLNFDRGDSNSVFYGKVKQLIVFNEALSDSELQTLTTL